MVESRVFIGSSSEQIQTLQTVQALIGSHVKCIPWTNAFQLNKSALDSLIKHTRLSDFAILIATKDDLVKKRDKKILSPRDNVVFEFGLFLGAAGAERCFLLAEDGTGLPSDLAGINLSFFSQDPMKHNSLEKEVAKIKAQMEAVSKKSELGLLPSTALAIGYYNGFIKKVCEEVHKTGLIAIEGKKVKIKSFKINVVIPSELDDSGVGDFATIYNKANELAKATTFIDVDVNANGRGYPFHFKVDPPDQDMETPIDIHVSDVPNTIGTIKEALKLYLPSNSVGPDFDLEYLEKRELQNFANVLAFLVSKNSLTKKEVSIESGVKI